MPDNLQINNSTIRLVKGDITDFEIDSFVFYARNDLVPGAGFGNAISIRGGPSIQEELKQFGTLNTTECVITSAGEMKVKYIIHAVGPKFQEEDLENKLRTTILNSLKKADEKDIKGIAFPPMGTGFYGVPLNKSAEIMIETIIEYLSGDTKLKDVVIILQDNREYKPYREYLTAKNKVQEER